MMKSGSCPLGLIAVLALSGCMASQPASPDLPQRIIPAPHGLTIAESGGQEISFGRAQLGVEVAITRLVGTPFSDGGISAQGCALRRWKNGLTLVFDKGRFVGWIAGQPVWQTSTKAGNTCGL